MSVAYTKSASESRFYSNFYFLAGVLIVNMPLGIFTTVFYAIFQGLIFRGAEKVKSMNLFLIASAVGAVGVWYFMQINLASLIALGWWSGILHNYRHIADKLIQFTLHGNNVVVLAVFGAFLASFIARIGHFLYFNLKSDEIHQAKDNEQQEKKLKAWQKTTAFKKSLQKALDKIKSYSDAGTVLGVSFKTLLSVIIPDSWLNQILLVLGTTGSGKTITIRGFYERAIKSGSPLIIVDGKPDEKNIKFIRDMAEKNGKKFYGYNCENFINYDCFSVGDNAELKDKIISIKDEWSSDHYKTLSANFLQVVIEAMQSAKIKIDFNSLIKNMCNIQMLMSNCENDEIAEKLARKDEIEEKDISGLINHIEIFSNSTPGRYLTSENAVTVTQAIEESAVMFFALPAMIYPEFARDLGKLVINDIKATIARVQKKTFCVFDEFSVFAGQQVTNLVNQGRGYGLHAVLGTQGVSDLEEVSPAFLKKVLNNVNTIICHRINTDEETISKWAGTKDVMKMTDQIDNINNTSEKGSMREVKEFIIHPDDISRLQGGECFVISKMEENYTEKVKVLFRK